MHNHTKSSPQSLLCEFLACGQQKAFSEASRRPLFASKHITGNEVIRLHIFEAANAIERAQSKNDNWLCPSYHERDIGLNSVRTSILEHVRTAKLNRVRTKIGT
jgi:hypothetical protein